MLFPQQPFVRFPVNTVGRDFFFGDLHGCVGHLERLMAAVRFKPDRDRLFSVGDLIDHGPESLRALECLKTWPFFHAVMGNHEAMALGSLNQLPARLKGPTIWMSNGGEWSRALSEDQWQLAREVLTGMPLAMEIPLRDGTRVGMVHAELQSEQDWKAVESLSFNNVLSDDSPFRSIETELIWGRGIARTVHAIRRDRERSAAAGRRSGYEDVLGPALGIDVLISGHTITDNHLPVVEGNRWFIDTGSYHRNGKVTLVEPLTNSFWQVGWRKDGMEPQKRVSARRLLTQKPIASSPAGTHP